MKAFANLYFCFLSFFCLLSFFCFCFFSPLFLHCVLYCVLHTACFRGLPPRLL